RTTPPASSMRPAANSIGPSPRTRGSSTRSTTRPRPRRWRTARRTRWPIFARRSKSIRDACRSWDATTTTSRCSAGARAAGRSEEQARRIVPRADLSGLTDEQRSQFLEVAGDVFDYAGCRDTLAKCLAADVQDVHALRMAGLVKALILEGGSSSRVIEMVENYYASFEPSKRQPLKANDCPVLGDPKAPVAVVEFSDYQCPHCAVANKPLHDLVTGPEK